jgi:hypothetical protein
LESPQSEDLDIINSPEKFRELFLAQVNAPEFDKKYRAILYVFLYFIWRGIQLSIKAWKNDSKYKSFLPILQNIRLGYPADSFILIRALMERIALIGYLQEKPELIPRFSIQGDDLSSAAMTWATKHAPENWGQFYGFCSNIVHSKYEGMALNIYDSSIIGKIYQRVLSSPRKKLPELSDELFLSVYYALFAIEPFSGKVIDLNERNYFPTDRVNIFKYVSLDDILKCGSYIRKVIKKYQAQMQ